MGRHAGTQKTGGRQAGTPNRKTLDLEARLSDLNVDVPKQLFDLLPELEPAKRAEILLDLMSFLYPKRKAIERTEIVDESFSKRLHAIESMTPEQRAERLKRLQLILNETDGE